MGRRKMNEDRSLAVRQVTDPLGFSFLGEDEFGESRFLRSFKFYREARFRKEVHNLAQRSDPMLESTLSLFDFAWRKPAGNSARWRYQTTFFIRSKQLLLPDFYMRPEHFFDRIGTWLGAQDIDFEEYPKFSRNNLLKGEDEQLVRDLLVSPQFARMFKVNRQWTIEGLGYYLVIYKRHKLLTAGEIRKLLKQGLRLLEILRQPG